MKWVTVDVHGKKVRAAVMKANGKLWVHWQGETHVLELNSGGRRAQSAQAKVQPGVICAPMPGKVTKVAVQVEETVRKGQPLVVLEAMKMEYTLEADCDGKVEEVNVQAGKQVGLGDVLVRVVEA